MSPLWEVCCWSCTRLCKERSLKILHACNCHVLWWVHLWHSPYLFFPGRAKIACRCQVLNPIDAFLTELHFNLLIIPFLNSFLEFCLCTDDINSPVAAHFSDWSPSIDEMFQCLETASLHDPGLLFSLGRIPAPSNVTSARTGVNVTKRRSRSSDHKACAKKWPPIRNWKSPSRSCVWLILGQFPLCHNSNSEPSLVSQAKHYSMVA